jgi:hypothetical protein
LILQGQEQLHAEGRWLEHHAMSAEWHGAHAHHQMRKDVQDQRDLLPMKYMVGKDFSYAQLRAARVLIGGIFKNHRSTLGWSMLEWKMWMRRMRKQEREERAALASRIRGFNAVDDLLRRMWKRLAFRKWYLRALALRRAMEEAAAIVIQRAWRWKYYRDLRAAGLAQIAQLKMEQLAKIKAAVGFERDGHNSCWYVVRTKKDIKTGYWHAVTLQCAYRCHLARREYDRRMLSSTRGQMLQKAATMIQCAWRCWKARRDLEKARLAKLRRDAMRDEAASILQRYARGMNARSLARHMRAENALKERMAIRLQQAYRKHLEWMALKRRFERRRMMLMEARMAREEAERLRRAAAATIVQNTYRSWLSRMWRRYRKRQMAQWRSLQLLMCTRIQVWYRTQCERFHLVSRFEVRRMMLALHHSGHDRNLLFKRNESNHAAQIIQARMRCKLTQFFICSHLGEYVWKFLRIEQLHVAMPASAVICKWFRWRTGVVVLTKKCIARRSILDVRDAAANFINRFVRGCLGRYCYYLKWKKWREDEEARKEAERLRHLNAAATCIQIAWRRARSRYLMKQAFQRRRELLDAELLRCTIFIQRMWRGKLAQERLRWMKIQLENEQKGAEYRAWQESERLRLEQEAREHLVRLRRLKDAEAARLAGMRRGKKVEALKWEVKWSDDGSEESFFENMITGETQWETPVDYIFHSTCKVKGCQVTGKMGLVEDPRKLKRGTFYCFAHWDIFEKSMDLLEQPLPEGWMQIFEEDSVRLRYLNTVSNIPQYDPRPTISAMETLRLEAERRKLEAMVAHQKLMADRRRQMRKIADAQRNVKGWTKQQWKTYWDKEEELPEAWDKDSEAIDAFALKHGAGDPMPLETARSEEGGPTGRSTVRSLAEMDDAAKPGDGGATGRSTTRGTARISE